ncbi:MAG: hypothetical protein AAGC66_13385 [Leifsonia sp.]
MSAQSNRLTRTLWVINSIIACLLIVAGTFCFSALFPKFALYERTGAWVAEAVPPIVQLNGREYEKCEKTSAITEDERAYPVRGRTEGGAAILAPAGDDTPVLIFLRTKNSFYECSLIGGP